MSKILVSIVIATFNSSKTLPLVLDSIKKQSLDKNSIEILLVDGGSTDNTISISKEYSCKIYNNPKTEPINAKMIGFHNALGRYCIFLDHDEVLESKNSIKDKIEAFAFDTRVKAVAGSGYKSPEGRSIINNYINEFGDPFSFYIYGLTKDCRFFINTMKQRYKTISETKKFVIFDLSSSNQLPILELVAGGTAIDMAFFKNEFKEAMRKNYFLGQAFNLMYLKNPYIAITKNDCLVHYSSDNMSSYIKKINWRVKNNIFFRETTGKAGYFGRDTFQSKLQQFKKYMYLPHTLLLIPLVIDTLWLMVTRKDVKYSIHFILSLYTAVCIIYFYLIFISGKKLQLRSYDESKIVVR